MECTWQVRLATKRRIEPTPDYATLKRDPIVAAAYDAALRRGLATVKVEDGDTAGRLRRLCEATAQAASGLPLVKRQPLRKRVVSANMKLLYEERARCYHLTIAIHSGYQPRNNRNGIETSVDTQRAYSTGKVPSNNFRIRPLPHSQNVTN